MRHSRSSHRVSEAPQTGHAVCDAHVSHPSQPARHLADSAQNARARALPRDERMPAELRGRGYRVSPLSPPLASCDPAPVADMTKRVPKRTCARRAHGAATQRTHPALIKRTPSLASAMCVAHRKAPLAFLCSPPRSLFWVGGRAYLNGIWPLVTRRAPGSTAAALIEINPSTVRARRRRHPPGPHGLAHPGGGGAMPQPLGGGRLRPAGATCCLRPREAAKCSLLHSSCRRSPAPRCLRPRCWNP